ncbi:MAG TPA: molybdate ABC transporter substrate-binding protein [Roseiflexaceae bacterium]|nr:molybdate ABC transporter substrate-binding protein [Roseiflexaceae bacterium]HMP42201.1 molybdate ABC transporter substrate-binding protein [Roseiflexaceae bacterium]
MPCRLLACMLVGFVLLVSCGQSPGVPAEVVPLPSALPMVPVAEEPISGVVTVFAAASLADAFEELAVAFTARYPAATVSYNFAGSQQLAAQINEGAPADVFASANQAQMQVAIAGGRVQGGSEQTFVRNRLVVITPRDNPAGITSLPDLARPGLRLILADAAVPVGRYSLDFLAHASSLPEYTTSYSATVLANVVSFEESVRAVLTKVVLGEADAGIVYTTDAALDADRLQQIEIPDTLNTIASYPIALLVDSGQPRLARAFIDFVLADEGQRILGRYGFLAPLDSQVKHE